jgi:dolichyl-phosphate beta-glucosyltransferase
VSQRSSVSLSIVIPAYNEQARIGASLQTIVDALPELVEGGEWEVIVANDGSTDETARIVEAMATDIPQLWLLTLPHRGKGATVRDGILAARGAYVLFSDADLATPITEARKLICALHEGAEVAIGSREAPGSARINEPLLRHAMGRVFSQAVQLILMRQFADTQCGFKAFTREAADRIFSQVALYSNNAPVLTRAAVTGFDVEVLYLALRYGYQIAEVPVEWHYRPHSKVSPARDSYELLRDVVRVRRNALRGVYDTDTPRLMYSQTDVLSEVPEKVLLRG